MTDKPGKRTPSLDPSIQMHLGRRLRSIFEEVASEPVPDRFLNLLDQLEKAGADESVRPERAPGSRHSEQLTPTETAGPSK
ncbi:MAG: hypothetical protein KGM42_07060 [Hyphomicrobiales bacterium]|nr:hypothetical protein [Hyphomicrobiales bacterium]